MAEAINVFEQGTYFVRCITVERSDPSSPPKPLLIITPTIQGKYPVLMFCHGFWIENASYTELLRHISSHGYIVVAPQLYTMMFTCGAAELGAAADVTCWLSSGGLNTVLPQSVEPDLLNLALAGHGRGGKAAFALALGLANASLKFSLLLGLDPVEGTDPKVLTHIPRSFDLTIPVVVIGTGLGDNNKFRVLPACAPDGRNHEAFFTECKPPCWYFYARNYGHMDMIDYGKETLTGCLCVSGTGPRGPFRKCLAGIFVAVLRAYLEGQTEYLQAIADQPSIAPTRLDPVIYIEA
ncbi:Chlorophyllase-2 like [Actinidia chinensis var. chinensis]|uniref:Chlorophyllase-2 like n=1 Tax=Actinidia chinensis var. chinensis TaxID=1590841 RepID=A0A2R6QDZ0_ACTCC|nr:Chlorophyllase-2 like [Actinidia chinensis var. chinensis]